MKQVDLEELIEERTGKRCKQPQVGKRTLTAEEKRVRDNARRKKSRDRQARFVEKQRSEGRKRASLWLTDEEAFYLERCLMAMREHDAAPSQVRKKDGTYRRVDI